MNSVERIGDRQNLIDRIRSNELYDLNLLSISHAHLISDDDDAAFCN